MSDGHSILSKTCWPFCLCEPYSPCSHYDVRNEIYCHAINLFLYVPFSRHFDCKKKWDGKERKRVQTTDDKESYSSVILILNTN